MKVYFQEVKYHEKKSGKCSVCGKTCTISKKFYQTLNPFNKNADGTIKTHGDIYKELMIQIKEWKKIPPIHGKCEDVSNGNLKPDTSYETEMDRATKYIDKYK